jgi:hypothetical protein
MSRIEPVTSEASDEAPKDTQADTANQPPFKLKPRRTPPGVEPTIKYEGVRHAFAADKHRGDRAAWLASGSNRTFEEWKADRDAEALALAKVNQEALIAEMEAKRLEVEGRKAEAEARRAQKALAKARAEAAKVAAEAEKDALPADYKGMFESLSSLFTATTDRKIGLLVELQAQRERTFLLTIHQFMRLDNEWWNEPFKKMVGHRATAIHKEMFGGRPFKQRMSKMRSPDEKLTADTRYWVNLYPRGVIEQAFAQVVAKLTKAGTVDQYAVEPFRKVVPGGIEAMDEVTALLDAVGEVYKEAQEEGRQIRSKEQSTNWGDWKGKRLRGLNHKLVSNEIHGPSWVKRVLPEALASHPEMLVNPIIPPQETSDSLEKPEETE